MMKNPLKNSGVPIQIILEHPLGWLVGHNVYIWLKAILMLPTTFYICKGALYNTSWLPGFARVPCYAPIPCHMHPLHNCHHTKLCPQHYRVYCHGFTKYHAILDIRSS